MKWINPLWKVPLTLISGYLLLITMVHAQTTSDKRELILLNWAEYMDPTVLQDFETRFHAKVKEVFFESNSARDELLGQTEGKGYDVVVVNPRIIPFYVKRGWLIPLGGAQIPNIKHIDPFWMKVHQQAEEYAIPYMTGTIGLVYRRDMVKPEITSWKQYFQPDEALRGKIFVIDDQRPAIGFALKALNYSYNSTDKNELTEAQKLLLTQKPYVQNYGYLTALDENSGVVVGKTWVAMIYNGDALKLQKHHPELVYVIPREGGAVWVDSMVILKQSKQQKLAMQFINFLHEPEIAARLSVFNQYATPNQAAAQFLPAEHLNNPAIYPPDEVIKRSEFTRTLPPRITKARNEFFSKLIQ